MATAAEDLEQAEQLLGAGRASRAEELFAAVIASGHETVRATYGRGVALIALKRPAEAETAMRAVLTADPRHVNALYYLGQISAGRGQVADARRLLASALALKPDHAGALSALADLSRSTDQSLAKQLESRRVDAAALSEHAGAEVWSLRPALHGRLRVVLVGVALLVLARVAAHQQMLDQRRGDLVAASFWNQARRLLAAVGWPALVGLVALILLSHWFIRYTLQERCLTVESGVLVRRRLVIWLYELSVIPVESRDLLDAILQVRTVSIGVAPDAATSGFGLSTRKPPRLKLRNLALDRAPDNLVADLRSRIAVERRAMIGNFIGR